VQTNTALVTGAASGIGRATVAEFRDRGWNVLATDVDEEGLSTLPAGVTTARMDMTDPNSIEQATERVRAECEGLDCLVNNAGFAVTGPLEDVAPERLREQMEVLVHGPHHLLGETLSLLRRRSGTVVTVTSVLGRVSFPGAGTYCAAKSASEAFGDALRMELDDVEAALVEPAWVDTGFADRADQELDGGTRSSRYEWIYRGYEGLGPLDGGPLTVSPERVAETIVEAGTATDPRSRYPVGWQSRAVVAARYLPDAILDPARRATVRVAGWL
jgi:NAD(P)-dependent dehydrogenase (short-subunit alcohol dehydrogenase family)